MLSRYEKIEMAKSLSDFRERHSEKTQYKRLSHCPIPIARFLFNTREHYPCKELGKYLVFKIIDELLDV